jgi:hypothetical protein
MSETQQRDRDTLEMLTGGLMSGEMLDDAPEGVQSFVHQLADILEEAAKPKPPHVCEDSCRCRQAYRRALARGMEDWERRN